MKELQIDSGVFKIEKKKKEKKDMVAISGR